MKITFDLFSSMAVSEHSLRSSFEKLKYCSVLIFPVSALIAFSAEGFLTSLSFVLLFGAVPVLELFFAPDHRNFDKKEKNLREKDGFFNWFLYLLVPVLICGLVFFLFSVAGPDSAPGDLIGKTLSMGVLCGIAINLGHELGHRRNRFEQLLGEISLLISLENHFLPYHNLGHHRFVATPSDPATARRNEPVYRFWLRSQTGSYLQAWQFEFGKMRRRGKSPFSFQNRMVGYTIAQLALITAIYLLFGGKATLAFVAAAIIGKLMLETVNYIEHYGLLRKKKADGKYERVLPEHSWNSDHIISRSIMLELSRHSDHHFKAGKHYQILDSRTESPQMPTGYPGMMLFSLVPPLWFRYMNRRIDDVNPGNRG